MNRILIIPDENSYTLATRSLRKFNMTAYKQLLFEVLPSLRAGSNLGTKQSDGTYKVYLKADSSFEFVYGKIYLIYSLEGKNAIMIHDLCPFNVLHSLYKKIPPVIDGVPICDSSAMFKLNLYKRMKGEI